MKVSRWQVNGYKSFPPSEVPSDEVAKSDSEFEVGEFSVLIGKNNSGKSNLISSFQDYRDLFDARDLRSWYRSSVFNQNQSLSVDYEVEFTLNLKEQRELLFNLCEEESLPEEIADTSLEEGYFTKIRHQFSVHENVILQTSVETNFENGWLVVSSAEDLKTRSTGQYDGLQFNHLPNEQHSNISTSIHSLKTIIPSPFRAIMQKEIQTWEAIEAFREPYNQQSAGKAEDLDPTGENLVQVVNTLHNNYPELFNQFRDRYVSIMEGVTNVSTPYVGGQDITIRIHEGENSYDLEEISAGSKEILTLIAGIVSSQNDTSLLLIEEPELHVHPGAEQEIYDLIQEICHEEGIQVIVSTHSEVFVNRSSASSIVRVERENWSTIRSVAEGEIAQELTDLGYSKSGLLQSNAVVFVEGRSDKRILTQFCKKLGVDPDEQGIAFVELEGKENLRRDGRSLVKLLYSFDIPYLFVVDSDDQSQGEAVGELLETINRSDRSGWWETSPENFHAWEQRSIESYLLDADAVARGEEFDMGSDEVEEIISGLDDLEDGAEVLEEVYREEHDIEEGETAYRKDRDGMYIAKRMKRDEVPDEVRDVVGKIGGLVGMSLE